MSTLKNPKHELFCLEYLKDLNATRAYRAVYGCSQKSAESQGTRLLGNVRVSSRVTELLERRKDKLRIDAENVLREYARLGFSDILNYVSVGPCTCIDEEGRETVEQRVAIRNSGEWDEDAARAVSEIRQAKDGSLSFKLHDKRGALDKLAQHLGLLVDRVDHTSGGERLASLSDDELRARVLAAIERMRGKDGND